MTFVEFQNGINRLITQYGPSSYTSERTKIFYREVRDLDAKWWDDTVSMFIATLRSPPLLPEIRDQITLHRERQWYKEKAKAADEAKEFFKSSIPSEEVPMLMSTIKRRMLGQVSDQEWEAFMKLLDGFGIDMGRGCKICNNTGIVITRDNYVYKCRCHIGRQDPRNYPIYNNA